MAIDGINGNAPNWNVLLNGMQETAGANKGEETGRTNANLVLTQAGTEQVRPPSTPSIETPNSDGYFPEQIESLIDKLGTEGFNYSGEELKQFNAALRDTVSRFSSAVSGKQTENTQQSQGVEDASAPTGTKTVLFDLYQMLALLTECAQSLKDAQRDQRQAEMSAMITSIQNQADAQRSAALTGMIAGGLVCLMQVGASCFAAAKTISNTASEAQLSTQFGVTDAAGELGTAQTELNSARTELNNFNTEHPLPAEGEAPEAAEITQQRTQLQTKVDQAKANLMDKKIAYESKMTEMKNSPEYQALEKSQAWTRAIADISQAVGNLGQTLVRGAVDMQQAEATAMGADQKKAEEGLAATKDLMDSFQEVIDKMLQLLQAVQQAENQSMSDAIHA